MQKQDRTLKERIDKGMETPFPWGVPILLGTASIITGLLLSPFWVPELF